MTTSPIKIACHVRADEVERAVAALHEALRARRAGGASARMPRVGVVGATGAVGTVTLELLRERGFDDVRAFASARSAGERARRRALVVEEATPEALAAGDLDLCLFSVGTRASRELVPHAVRGGAVCVDKSAAYRLAGRRAARRARGERRPRARARRHRRQPELLRDPADAAC